MDKYKKLNETKTQQSNNVVKESQTNNIVKESQNKEAQVPSRVGSNESVTHSWAYVTKTHKKEPIVISSDVSNNIREEVTKMVKERAENSVVRDKSELIDFETKKERVKEELNLMARTMAMRVGAPGTTKKLAKMCMEKNMEKMEAGQTAIKTMAQRFIINELKMSMTEWQKVKTVGFELEEHVDCDIVLIIFKSIADIALVNVHLTNLTKQSANKIYQHVPKNLMTRFKGFEKAAQIIRNQHDNTVNTKICPGKQDFYLLVRRKGDQTSWASIGQTLTPIDMDARFEIGVMNKEQQLLEDNYLKELMKSMANANSRNQEYKTKRKEVDYEWNTDDNEREFEELINIFMSEENFNKGVDANSTLMNQNNDVLELNNKRGRTDNDLNNSLAKKNKNDSEEPIKHD